MLNPSTADGERDDPTIRRCIDFARKLRCGGLQVVNLFALRATSPSELLTHPEPVGEKNDYVLASALRAADSHIVICAWGAHGIIHGRDREFLKLAREKAPRRDLTCYGFTKRGSPRHPLYLRSDAKLFPYAPHMGESNEERQRASA